MIVRVYVRIIIFNSDVNHKNLHSRIRVSFVRMKKKNNNVRQIKIIKNYAGLEDQGQLVVQSY